MRADQLGVTVPVAPHRAHGRGEYTDAGFSVVEVMIASMVSVVLFVIFSTSVNLAVTEMRDTRFRSEAAGIAGERVEIGRGLQWDGIAMIAVDPSAPLIDVGAATLLASEVGLDADEPLVIDAAGGFEARAIEIVDDVTYVVWSYVATAGSGASRVVVFVEWDVEGRAGSFMISTVIAEVTL